MGTPILWLERAAGRAPERRALTARVSLTPAGPVASTDEPAVLLMPVRRSGRSIAVALVPPRLARALRIDGVRVPAGVRAVCHGSCLECGTSRLWLAAGTVPETRPLTSDVDGDEVFCARTKARLVEGEPIVVCPGTPERECGLVYGVTAWEADFPCHGCGRRRDEPEWQPPAEARDAAHPRLLQLARERRSS